jgi:hypothetical protein
MNTYPVRIVPHEIRFNAFDAKRGFAVIVECPIPDTWDRGNVIPGGGTSRHYIAESGEATTADRAFVAETPEAARNFAANCARKTGVDRNIHLLTHPSAVFQG